MILKAYYSGGRIDVFDTDHHVDAVPQRGNLLANYTLDLSDVAGDGIWLRSYYHEAAEAYREEPGPTGLPVARRRDGWSFLVADADDLERINRLTVDGETVLIRVGGRLCAFLGARMRRGGRAGRPLRLRFPRWDIRRGRTDRTRVHRRSRLLLQRTASERAARFHGGAPFLAP